MILVVVLASVFHFTEVDIPVHLWAEKLFKSTEYIFDIITYLGEGWVQVVFCYLVSFYYYRNASYIKSKFWFWAGPISLLAGVVGQLFKRTIGRPRPRLFDQQGLYDFQWFEWGYKFHSLPSGHTLTTFAIVGFVAHLYPKSKYWMIAGAALIGFTRIAVGMHWLADVVAGAALGYILGKYFSKLFFKREAN